LHSIQLMRIYSWQKNLDYFFKFQQFDTSWQLVQDCSDINFKFNSTSCYSSSGTMV
jgi:hypothetical protein